MTIDGTAGITFPDASVQATGNGLIKAWVNFNGTVNVSPATTPPTNVIRAAFNVSSVTDNGTGNYTVNFAKALTDANYAVVAMTNTTTAASTNRVIGISSAGDSSAPTTKTASAVRLLTGLTSLADMENVNVLVIR